MIQSSQLSEALQVQSNDQELALFQTVPSVSGARNKKKKTKEHENVTQILKMGQSDCVFMSAKTRWQQFQGFNCERKQQKCLV